MESALEEMLKIRFLFYKQERSISTDCLALGELLDLISRGYPGAQILGIEVVKKSRGNRPMSQEPDAGPRVYDEAAYCSPA